MKSSTLCISTVLLMAAAASAQTARQHWDVSVTDPKGRFVTGLAKDMFEVVGDDGVRRPVTVLMDSDTPMSLAIVSEHPLQVPSEIESVDEVIQMQTVSTALRQLAISKNPRKVLLIGPDVDAGPVPSDVQLIRIEPENPFRAVIEFRSRYRLVFALTDPADLRSVQVVVKAPFGIPPLRVSLK